MSAIGEAISAVKEALQLSEDVKRAGETLKEVARELRDQDRRITRLEAQWDTALVFSQRNPPGAPRQIEPGAD